MKSLWSTPPRRLKKQLSPQSRQKQLSWMFMIFVTYSRFAWTWTQSSSSTRSFHFCRRCRDRSFLERRSATFMFRSDCPQLPMSHRLECNDHAFQLPHQAGSRCNSLLATLDNNNMESRNFAEESPSILDDDDDFEKFPEGEALDVVEESLVGEDDIYDLHQMSEEEIAKLPKGFPSDCVVVKHWSIPSNGLDLSPASNDPDRQAVIQRLQLTPTNVSLPLALTLLFPEQFTSLTHARKACRKGNFILHQGPWLPTDDGLYVVDRRVCKVGRVGDRVLPGDVIAKQVRLATGSYRATVHAKPPMDLEVIFEDDHVAAVNKPAGLVVHGLEFLTVRAILPFSLTPPRKGTWAALRRPISVHRLDKPTSGILLCVKTRPAMLDLSQQFRHRVVRKTYVAIVNGRPLETSENSISSRQAIELGVDVNPNDESTQWQLINHPLEEKSAVTVWRAVRHVPSINANDGCLTLVELKPKTGRYHQLRRHMAWVCQRPLVGDDEYDGGSEEAQSFREHGLFLCANHVTLEHPFYNTESGRRVYDGLGKSGQEAGGSIWVNEKGRVMVTLSIDVPAKFQTFLAQEEEKFGKLSVDALQNPVVTTTA